ncbi:MAG: hypothetical protein HXX19_11325 [Rhodoferax sp.]|nr:hypothetical protein [Rhodoferax sp.]
MSAILKQEQNERRKALSQQTAGDRSVIVNKPWDTHAQAGQVESLIVAKLPVERCVAFGGVVSSIVETTLPYAHLANSTHEAPAVTRIQTLEHAGVRALVEAVAIFESNNQFIAVPPAVIEQIIEKDQHCVQTVTGLLYHPIVLANGEILAANGLHQKTGLYFKGIEVKNIKPLTQKAAKTALKRLKDKFLSGFEFQSSIDADVAVTALFTGLQRKILPMAPGFAFLAPVQASGKTTLARMIHLVLTGQEMSVMSFPERNEEEMQKRMLAVLLTSPAMLCLDNMTDGTTFESTTIAAVMTSPVWQQRILSLNKNADCPTNVLMIATGNNLGLGADEVSRWLPAYLNPKTSNPAARTFKNPNVAKYALSIRAEVIEIVVGIISGYLKFGFQIPSRSRFTEWDKLVRQPLIWAGASDVAQVFDTNKVNSASNGGALATVVALSKLFGKDAFGASQVAGMIATLAPTEASVAADLKEALQISKSKNPTSPTSVGRALKGIENRRIEHGQSVLTLKSRLLDGLSKYYIEVSKLK